LPTNRAGRRYFNFSILADIATTIWGSFMRTEIFGDGIRTRAIAGTYTVLFAFDADDDSRKNLLGFAIRRQDPEQHEDYWLKGLKVFPSVVPKPKKGARYSTLEQPVQSFLWGDYTA
jgi:hypothetical protein